MPLPLATEETKNKLSLDELIADMSHDRQHFDQPERPEVPLPGDREKIDPEAGEKLSWETARTIGEEWASYAVNGTKGGCALISGEKAEKYSTPKPQEAELAKSYAKVAAHYNIAPANPIWNAAFLSLIILGPQFRTALQDKRLKEIEQEQQRQAEEQQRQAEEQRRQMEELNASKEQMSVIKDQLGVIEKLKSNTDAGTTPTTKKRATTRKKAK